MTCRIEKKTNFLPILLKHKMPKGILSINTSNDTGIVKPNSDEILLIRMAKPVKPLESSLDGVMKTLIQKDCRRADKKTQNNVLRYLKLADLVTIDNLILHFIVMIIAIRYLAI